MLKFTSPFSQTPFFPERQIKGTSRPLFFNPLRARTIKTPIKTAKNPSQAPLEHSDKKRSAQIHRLSIGGHLQMLQKRADGGRRGAGGDLDAKNFPSCVTFAFF